LLRRVSGVSWPGQPPRRDRPCRGSLVVLTFSLIALLALLASTSTAGVGRAGWRPDKQEAPRVAQRLLDAGFPVYCGGMHGKEVALTFDDGPGPYTSAALDALAAHGATATFFVVGRKLSHQWRMLRREGLAGEIGNHTWSHPVLPSLSEPEIFTELKRPQQVLERLSGGSPQWLFRPPYGAHDSRVDAIARRLGLVTILWSVYTGDTALTDPVAIAVNTEAGARPGSIILLHENNSRGPTVAALPRILDMLAARGLRPVTLTELLTHDPPTDRQLRTGPYGCGPTVSAVGPSEGPKSGNTTVVITGDALNLPQMVYFGSHPAISVTGVSGHEIHAVAPPGSGTVDVTVTTHFSSSPTSVLDHYTYR
jgi:peptidoglycan/xylan/chitin deacetylase (PgdA/CDA1 family)